MIAIDDALATLERDGLVVLPELLPAATLDEIQETLAPLFGKGRTGRNDFEGLASERVYTLVARGKVFEDQAEHPLILEIMDRLLKPNYLLSANQAINILPGETPQNLHSDDPFYTIPRPRPPISISTMWAITDFTDTNGATDFVKGSHTLGDGVPALAQSDTQPGVAPAGSCIVYYGTTLHRGGRNRSDAPRLGIANQYCQPWARPQENFFLGVPKDRVRAMSPKVQALLGYSIHPPFMGQLSGSHPIKALEEGYVTPVERQEREEL